MESDPSRFLREPVFSFHSCRRAGIKGMPSKIKIEEVHNARHILTVPLFCDERNGQAPQGKLPKCEASASGFG
jgi:hypothetical protein